MKIIVNRYILTPTYTLSKLYIDGVHFCESLEDVYRGDDLQGGKKIYGKTAIPCGTYKVIVSYSNRFKIWTPELLNVPFFIGIRIHSGNTHKDTEGCILVGENKDEDGFIYNSRRTFKELMIKLKDQKDISIEVKLAENGK
jgi:hypothetical protein